MYLLNFFDVMLMFQVGGIVTKRVHLPCSIHIEDLFTEVFLHKQIPMSLTERFFPTQMEG